MGTLVPFCYDTCLQLGFAANVSMVMFVGSARERRNEARLRRGAGCGGAGRGEAFPAARAHRGNDYTALHTPQIK